MITSALSIVIAGIIPSIIGFVWYHPRVFGSVWMRFSGIQPQHVVGKQMSSGLAFLGLVAGVVMAFVVQFEIQMDLSVGDALLHVSWLWIGFVATVAAASFLWERKPLSLYIITASYWLFTLGAMTTVLFYFH